MKTEIIAIFLMVIGGCASGQTAPALPAGRPLPETLVSVLAQLKAETNVPIFLPGELPRYFGDAKHAMLEKASADEYVVVLYYELGMGNAGFAASFMATENAGYSPRELPNVSEVKLPGGTVGFFRPVSCGGSCAPANLWWERGDVLYGIQLKLPSTMAEKKQLRFIKSAADSAILAGPR
jgi:hypothetical protein